MAVSSRFARWFIGREQSLPRILVLDGGVSTHLGDTFRYRQLWSSSLLLDEVNGEEILHRGHLDWLRAGANVLSTVTYQCHYQSALWPSSITFDTARVDRMWSDAIRIAQEALEEYEQEKDETLLPNTSQQHPHCLLVSSGCYGAALANGAEYTGDYYYGDDTTTQDELMDFHRRKLQRVQAIDPEQVVAIETVPSLAECEALRALFGQEDNLPPCTIAFACRNGSELNDGTPLATALDVLADVPVERLVGWGINCCPPAYVAELLSSIADHPPHDRGLLVYPNAGDEWDADNEAWVTSSDGCDDTVEHIMEAVRQMKSPRNVLVGGCCRTTPDTIRKLQSSVQKYLLAER